MGNLEVVSRADLVSKERGKDSTDQSRSSKVDNPSDPNSQETDETARVSIMLHKAMLHRLPFTQEVTSMRRVTELPPATAEVCDCCGKVAAGHRLGLFESTKSWWVLGSDVQNWVSRMRVFLYISVLLSVASVTLLVFSVNQGAVTDWTSGLFLKVSPTYPDEDVTDLEMEQATRYFWSLSSDSISSPVCPLECKLSCYPSLEDGDLETEAPKQPRQIAMSIMQLLAYFLAMHIASSVLLFWGYGNMKDDVLGASQSFAAIVGDLKQVTGSETKIRRIIPISQPVQNVMQVLKDYKERMSRAKKAIYFRSSNWLVNRTLAYFFPIDKANEDLSALSQQLSDLLNTSGNLTPTAYLVECSDLKTARDLEASSKLSQKLSGQSLDIIIWRNINAPITNWYILMPLVHGVALALYATPLYVALMLFGENVLVLGVVAVLSMVLLSVVATEAVKRLYVPITTDEYKVYSAIATTASEIFMWTYVQSNYQKFLLIAISVKVAYEISHILYILLKKRLQMHLVKKCLKKPSSIMTQTQLNATFEGLEIDVCRLYVFDAPLVYYSVSYFAIHPSVALVSIIGVFLHYILIRVLMKYEYREAPRTQVFSSTRVWLIFNRQIITYIVLFMQANIRMVIIRPLYNALVPLIGRAFVVIVWVVYKRVMGLTASSNLSRMKDGRGDTCSSAWHPIISDKRNPSATLTLTKDTLDRHISVLMNQGRNSGIDEDRKRGEEYYNWLRILCVQVADEQKKEKKDWLMMETMMKKLPGSMKDLIQRVEEAAAEN